MHRLDQIRIVMSHTSHPGNVGSAARAMKTMGLAHLALVHPKRFPDRDGLAMSSRAFDVYAGAQLCDDIDAALAGTVLVFALTARPRDIAVPVVNPRDAALEAVEAASGGPVAFLFGNEESGLANDEILRAHRIVEIPANPAYASLNVAAAVQLVAWELRMAVLATQAEAASGRPRPPVPDKFAPATFEEIEGMHAHMERALTTSGFLDPRFPRRLTERLRRLFGRARLEREEVNILRGIMGNLERLAGGSSRRKSPD